MSNSHTYIKNLQLSGYRSIKEVSCEFVDDLNIIIGNNGSGKTNLLEFIYQILKGEYTGLGFFQASINLADQDGDVNFSAERAISTNLAEFKLQSNDVKESKPEGPIWVDFIKFSLPSTLDILGVEFNPKFDLEHNWLDFNDEDGAMPFSILFWLQILFLREEKGNLVIEKLNDEQLWKLLNESFNKCFITIKKAINNYTAVQDIRVSKSVRVVTIDSSILEFRNIVLEYKIDDEWLSWNALSDGTKRLLYLIFKIEGPDFTTDSGFVFRGYFPITLIEEPEIGIHPHQLHSLLNYLKEKAEEQQVILTTHSPQVLDILSPDELNKIIIAEIDTKKGTSLRHLNDKEINKAKAYFDDEGMLSDYWRFSDFQRSKNVK